MRKGKSSGFAVGTAVVVFGKHDAKVTAVSSNGHRLHVAGDSYSGWTKASNVKETL